MLQYYSESRKIRQAQMKEEPAEGKENATSNPGTKLEAASKSAATPVVQSA